jgi:hypothetical protein
MLNENLSSKIKGIQITTIKLINRNRNTYSQNLSINYGEHYPQNSSSLYPLVNIDKIFLSVYTKGIIVENEGIKKTKSHDDMLFL